MVEKLEDGHCVYANKSVKNGTVQGGNYSKKKSLLDGMATIDGVYKRNLVPLEAFRRFFIVSGGDCLLN